MKESTIKWLKAAGIRAAKTFAQAAIAAIITAGSMTVDGVNWLGVLSIAGLSAILSVLTSIKGLPEVPQEEGREG